ncbi:ABC transporter ATP-binding protein [Pseudonocardia acaciae]|uniref:ABC transporter ATP-binding protein n=1 Tax=Pseudonocardia acaciae TaxID=551276 RepID=UPI00068536DE|nr:ABC transporter ATP-binding protein [Pseudonocardia acaciae]
MTSEGSHGSRLAAEGVSKLFFAKGEPIWALRDATVAVAEGSFTCVIGPSGCGKSTLLRILGGLETATTGTVAKADGAAFVFQEHGVFPWLRVLDNVAFGARMAGMARGERTALARRWVERVGLAGFEDAYPHQLSGGMRQRVAIARAFATGSPVLLMDEPLGALDAQTRLLLQEELLRIWERERKTVVMVTHSIEEALLLGDRVLVMSARPGRVTAELEVPFARPRGMEVERDPEFAELRHRIWTLLRDEVAASLNGGGTSGTSGTGGTSGGVGR